MMFCRNCGKELLDDAKFCSSCGASTEIDLRGRTKNVQIENMYNLDTATILHYLSMICAAIIVFLSFSRWIRIECWGTRGNFSTWGLIKAISDLSKYVDTEIFSGFATLLVFLVITITSLSVCYILKTYRAGARTENNWHIVYGYPAMLAIAILCGIFAILAMITFSSNDDYGAISIYFNEKIYYIILLACLNRFVLLPKINNEIYKRTEAYILYDDEWLCERCQQKNEKKNSLCKYCGQFR